MAVISTCVMVLLERLLSTLALSSSLTYHAIVEKEVAYFFWSPTGPPDLLRPWSIYQYSAPYIAIELARGSMSLMHLLLGLRGACFGWRHLVMGVRPHAGYLS